jgi:hypothetical protein
MLWKKVSEQKTTQAGDTCTSVLLGGVKGDEEEDDGEDDEDDADEDDGGDDGDEDDG